MKIFKRELIYAFVIISMLTMPAHARLFERQTPTSQQEITLSFSPLVKKAGPAVVNIYATRMVRSRIASPFFNDPFFQKFFGEQFQIPQQQRQASSLGSGVIINADGLIITNYHVIKNADQVKVALADKREFESEIILKDERTDLAVLRIKNLDISLPFIEFGNSDLLEVGDLVLAIGNPFGVGQTVTQGIVSALARTSIGISDYQFFIQTDAAINPGNSGGALINMRGELIGINTAIFSRSGGSNGIGFAIPSNMVSLIANQAQQGQQSVRRPWLGASLQNVTADIAASLGMDRPKGVLVQSVIPLSAAAKANLQRGDVILSLDGQPIIDVNAFNYLFSTKGLEGGVTLDVLRRGKRQERTLELKPAPETRPRDERTITSPSSPLSGGTFVNLSPATSEQLGLPQTEGVAVTKVKQGTNALRGAQLQVGDIISAINGTLVESTEQLEKLVLQRSRFWRIVIIRQGRKRQIILRGR